jgi:hypothetical protein
MLKNFIRYFKDKFPELFDDEKYQQDKVSKEGHILSNYLVDNYSVEEQSTIVKSIIQNLLHHREEEIESTQDYLIRLKNDLIKLSHNEDN